MKRSNLNIFLRGALLGIPFGMCVASLFPEDTGILLIVCAVSFIIYWIYDIIEYLDKI